MNSVSASSPDGFSILIDKLPITNLDLFVVL